MKSLWQVGTLSILVLICGTSISCNSGGTGSGSPTPGKPDATTGGTTGTPSGTSGSTTDAGQEVKLNGIGATFPAPLYLKWFKAYNAAHPNVEVDYQAVGSSKGVNAVIDKTVTFGASDRAMEDDEMKKVDAGVTLLPMTAGSIVLAYNLPEVPNLQLSRAAYAGIFLGKITKWNDPAIAASNKDAKLPDSPINVVVRSDGSGTTFVFTKHLSAISPEFAKSPGTNQQPNWPVGTKSPGNPGVAASIKQTPGSIGYLEYGFAVNTGLAMAKLENKAGKFIEPTIASGQAALAAVRLPENRIAWLPDPDGDSSYPIDTFTWIICYKKYDSADKVKALKDVLMYGLTDGQKDSEKMGYIPLPPSVVDMDKAALDSISAK